MFERSTWEIFHDKIRHAIVFTVVDHPHNIGMTQPSQGLGFTLEAFEKLFGVLLAGEDNFDGDIAFQAGVIGFIYSRHATLAELLEDVVASEGVANEIRHN